MKACDEFFHPSNILVRDTFSSGRCSPVHGRIPLVALTSVAIAHATGSKHACFRPFMDYPFMDYPFMDYPFMDYPFMDYPFMDYPFMDYHCMDRHCMDHRPAEHDPRRIACRVQCAVPPATTRRRIFGEPTRHVLILAQRFSRSDAAVARECGCMERVARDIAQSEGL
jgi:hypothetical protein